MKRRSIKISSVLLSLILTAALLCCIMPFAVFAQDEYSAGDTFEFGSYPQSRVTDSALVSSLDGVSKSWVSYGFFAGTGKEGTMEESGYMQYCDITYGGEKYRAVRFTDFRPRQTYKAAGAASSFVDDNGFAADTVYYFKFEPVEWRILDPSSGLMVTSKITDSRAFSDRIYVNGSDNNGAACYSDAEYTKKACLYLSSSVYSFLNGEFYDTAFTADEQAQISSSTTVNDSFAGNYQQYSGDDSVDKVLLLSLSDISSTSYGFATGTGPDESRTAAGTDYAKILGLQPDETGNSPWWLRNAGNTSRNAGFVNYEGFAGMGSVEYTDKGIRPAIECTAILPQTSHTVTFDYDGGNGSETERTLAYGAQLGALPSASKVNYVFEGWFTAKSGGAQADPGQIIKADITLFARWSDCTHSFEVTDFKDSKCNEAGYKDYRCSVCGAEKREIIPMKAHTPVTDPGIDATCTMTGLTEGKHCSVCGLVIIPQEVIPEKGHTPAPFTVENQTTSTCTQAGEYDEVIYCADCGTELGRETRTKPLGEHVPLEAVRENELESTCLEGGHYDSVVYCGYCGEELEREYVETQPLGHDLIHHDGAASTCKDHGYGEYDTCSRCDYTTYEELPLAEHTPSPAVRENVKEPSCGSQGSYESVVYCSVCGKELSRKTETIPATDDHEDENGDGVCDSCKTVYDQGKYEEYIKIREREARENEARKVILSIRTPSVTKVKYGHTLVLHPEITGNIPDGYSAVWKTDGKGFEKSEKDGTLRLKSAECGETTVTLCLVDPDGNTVRDESGNEIQSSVKLCSDAGCFAKIIWFFKHIFCINMIIDE